VFQPSALLRTPNGARFQFPTIAGRKYRIEGTADLASGKWIVLVDAIAGTGEVFDVLDTEAAAFPQYFYRIILLP
jgi:hypothetical protein